MSDRRLDELADAIDGTDVPGGPGIAEIRRRARQRTTRRHTLSGAVIVTVLVAVVAGTGLLATDDAELTTAAPPVIEKFDRVPDGIGTWEFRSTDAIVSRTGESSGFGVRRVTGADDLLIYLTDGGICVDASSCNGAAHGFDGAELESDFVDDDGGPLHSLIGAGAPFAGWNAAVVPGITGDFHAGENDDVDVRGGPDNQRMVGATNLRAALADLFEGDEVPHDRVVLVGSGTGGLGALFTMIEVERAVGSALVGVIVDGGAIPRLAGQLPSCVVQHWGELTGLSFPADWNERVAPGDATNISGLYAYVADRFPAVEFVLVTNRDDPSMRRLFRAGSSACGVGLGKASASSFGRGIGVLEDHLAGLDGWASFVIESSGSNPIASSDDLTELGDLDALLRDLAEEPS